MVFSAPCINVFHALLTQGQLNREGGPDMVDSEGFMATGWEGHIKEDKDPNGVHQHSPGAKLDQGKDRPYLVISGFKHALQEVVKNGTFGANKYTDEGWKQVSNAHNRYLDAALRHFMKYDLHEDANDIDPESKVHHLAATAWNILAVLELILENKS